MKINFAHWKNGFLTGMHSPIMQAMPAPGLRELANAHTDCRTSHDLGIAAAALVLAGRAA
jgi:hypothetical protein